ncbi:MAG TPA: universal stress protein [Woeseiaceae bacterium]|nr:universal stress protein [Woeseiaceae bacterium]
MDKISRVLCVVDPTTSEQHAVDRAAWITARAGATLELFICTYNEYLSGIRYYDSPSLEAARKEVLEGYRRRLEGIAGPLRESGLNVVTKALWDHPLHEGVVRYAAATGADLVVKDTHYHSSIARALLSNTDWQLIRNCAVPLWLVKPGPMAEEPVFVSAVDPMNEHDKPAALDDEIICVSKKFAKICGGDVHVFHAYDPRLAAASATTNAYLPVSLPYYEIDKDMRERHGKRLNEITTFHGIKDDHTYLVSGRTEDELPELASKLDATVVVMGAVARNRLQRLFVGATAERTMDRLPCDLLVIKPDWFHTPEEILHKNEKAA